MANMDDLEFSKLLRKYCMADISKYTMHSTSEVNFSILDLSYGKLSKCIQDIVQENFDDKSEIWQKYMRDAIIESVTKLFEDKCWVIPNENVEKILYKLDFEKYGVTQAEVHIRFKIYDISKDDTLDITSSIRYAT